MIFTLKDAADYIAGLGMVEKKQIWIGKLQDKVDKSIGVYPLKRNGAPRTPIGGIKNSSYGIKRISILIHWNKSVLEAEDAANTLFDLLRNTRRVAVNEQIILFVQLLVQEPVSVGTDDNGIYEYVIEAEIFYERKGE